MTVDYLLVCEECWWDGAATIVGVRHVVAAAGAPLVVPPLVVAMHAQGIAVGGETFQIVVTDDAGDVVAAIEERIGGAGDADAAFSRLTLPAWDVHTPGTYSLQIRVRDQVAASTRLRIESLAPWAGGRVQ